MASLTLTIHEKALPVNVKWVAYLEAELKELRERNDEITLSAEQTAAFRGRIKFVKEALSQAKEEVKPGANLG